LSITCPGEQVDRRAHHAETRVKADAPITDFTFNDDIVFGLS
jgi:hypothetical protein